ncbi:MAG: type II toxin-antitoxin system prevent-host-death family antitoxin [Amaricoccus sp.]
MKVSVSEAKGQLTVKRAEAGDEVILTRRGREVARLVPVVAASDAVSRRTLMEKVRSASRKARPGPDSARSQDFLYRDDDGLPT